MKAAAIAAALERWRRERDREEDRRDRRAGGHDDLRRPRWRRDGAGSSGQPAATSNAPVAATERAPRFAHAFGAKVRSRHARAGSRLRLAAKMNAAAATSHTTA